MAIPASMGYRENNGTYYHAGPDVPFPVRTRGDTLLKKSEVDQLVPVGDYQAKLFNMAEPADQAQYIQVQNLIVNRQAAQRYRVEKFGPNDKAPQIWMEWVVMYMERPINYEPDRTASYGFQSIRAS